MLDLVSPFTKEQRSVLIDTSLIRYPTRSQVVGKLREYHLFPAFSFANVWRGASEIIARFDFDASLINLLNVFPLTPPTGANFVPVISWLKDEVYYRYKLWADVGEILWLPMYAKQKVTADFFSIEIWNTNTTTGPDVGLGIEDDGFGLGLEDDGIGLGLEGGGVLENLILSEAIRLYGSRLHIPTPPYCDLADLNLGEPTQCVDPIYHLEDFEPLYGDHYLLVAPCERQLIKGNVGKPTYNLLKNRDDNTWHNVWMAVVDGNVYLEVDPNNETPPVDALGYFPMIVLDEQDKIMKVELVNGPDGIGNYFVTDTEVESDDAFNVVLLQDFMNQDDAHLYGFYLRHSGTDIIAEVIQTIIPL